MGTTLTNKRDGSHKARIYLCGRKGTRAEVAPGEAGLHVDTHSSLIPPYKAVKLAVAHVAHYGNKVVCDDVIDAHLNGRMRYIKAIGFM